MSMVTFDGWLRGASLLALLMILPDARAEAQGRPFVLPSVTDTLGSPARQLVLQVPPVRLRLGLAQDDQSYAQDLLRPAPSLVHSAPRLMPAAFLSEEAPMVTCPMPVVRRDSSSVPVMPRLNAPLSDSGGVTIPSCRNPLDAP
jgi:hypothetical protein